MLSSGLLVVHDTSRGGKDNVTELTGGEEVGDPLLNIANSDVETGRDDTGLVKTTVELDNDLTRAVVIDVLKLINVTVSLHDGQELDDDLGGGSDENLSLTGFLGVGDGLKSVSENGSASHFLNKYVSTVVRENGVVDQTYRVIGCVGDGCWKRKGKV